MAANSVRKWQRNVKVLIVGNGGREHALAWKLLQSKVEKVVCVPGNGGTAMLKGCENLPLSVEDFQGIGQFALNQGISLVVVGPELPLSLGISDYLRSQGIAVFGPTQTGAQIEASKSWAKDLMQAAGVPTATAQSFTAPEAAKAYIQGQGIPIVVKVDGLAAGKGVTVATTLEQAWSAVEAAFNGVFGAAGQRIVIEECLAGQEVSVLALTDGLSVRLLLPAQDHKPVGEGDTGANTGGMGAYAPVPLITPDLLDRIQQEILEPVVAALRAREIDYRGVLYAGLMITPSGEPKVIEFNCRFGDPETQAILPLLKTPLETLLMACCKQRLAAAPPIQWRPGVAVCVVTAAQGYPGAYVKGKEIAGIEQARGPNVAVFHGGTKLQGQQLVTDGGRVLGVTAWGENFEQAIAEAYQTVEAIHYEGKYYRRDIGYRVRAAGSVTD